MASSSYYSCAAPVAVKPASLMYVATILTPPNQAFTEAWVLARAGMNNNGATQIRLVDEYGGALSDVTETFSSSAERIKMTGVRVPADVFPPKVRVEVTNKSTAAGSSAYVEGVLLVAKAE